MKSSNVGHGLAVAGLITLATLGAACGSDGGGGGPLECCDAECVSSVGYFTFKSEGKSTNVTGHATITEVASGSVLVDVDLMGWPTLEERASDAALAPFEGKRIEVDVHVDGVGFAPFDQRVSLDVARREVCCSSCINAEGHFDLELGAASNTFLNGCNPGGGDPACPLMLPNITDSCSAQLCCNYDAGGGNVIGCICNDSGTRWTCEQLACGCTGN